MSTTAFMHMSLQQALRTLKLTPSYDTDTNSHMVKICIYDRSFERGTTHVGFLQGYASTEDALSAGEKAAIAYIKNL